MQIGFALAAVIGGLAIATQDPVATAVGIAVFVAMGCCAFAKERSDRALTRRYFGRDTYDPVTVAKEFPALSNASRAFTPPSHQNVIVYSGFSPFVGSGIDLGGWSFVVDTSKPKERLGVIQTVKPFTIDEIYADLHRNVVGLGFATLSVDDILVVNGAEIADLDWLRGTNGGRPAESVGPGIVAPFMGVGSQRVRYYKTIRVVDWGSELAVTCFVRVSLSDRNLFVEASKFLLTPLSADYRKVDALPTPSVAHTIGALIGNVLISPFIGLAALFTVYGRLNRPFAERRQRKEWKRAIAENPRFDYGASTSLRDELASRLYFHYFQKLDGEMYLKFVEKRLLDSIIDFLDERDIDTTDLRQREMTIANNGVIVQGTIQAGAVAVGAQSTATAAVSTAGKMGKAAKSAITWTGGKGKA